MPVARRQIRNRHLLILDLLLLPVASYLSYVLRLERLDLGLNYPKEFLASFVLITVLALLVVPGIFRTGGVYSRYWRYASVEELFLLIGSTTLAVVVVTVVAFGARLASPRVPMVPRSIPFIFLLLALAVTSGPRVLARLVGGWGNRSSGSANRAPVLVVGAGNAGAMIVRELRQHPELGMEVIGFLDDDKHKHKMHIHGVPVMGSSADIPRLVAKYPVNQVIVAMPTAPGQVIRGVVKQCEQAGVQAKIVPGIYELLNGSISVNELRNVQIEDLLRREPVQTDVGAVRKLVEGRTVLVTGAGGSIGSELCRQLLHFHPAKLVLLGHGENSIFLITNELAARLATNGHGGREAGDGQAEASETSPVLPERVTTTRLVPVIADIRMEARIRAVIAEQRPSIVFHAAAHKHVPLMETNIADAVSNNILGTRTLLRAAADLGVERFVSISSDKAVCPTNVMGATKRAVELLVLQVAKATGRPYVAVRFGNVLGSRGSVVETFRAQIASGGPVTVTDPEMTRYFMTIPEAVQLVLQAAALGHGGEVYVLDMGEPMKIVDLARDMIELSGLEAGRDVEITFTGLRPGEKLYEELLLPGERHRATRHAKIQVVTNAYGFLPENLDRLVDEIAGLAAEGRPRALHEQLRRIVPEFRALEARSQEPGARSQESGVRSQESGARSR